MEKDDPKAYRWRRQLDLELCVAYQLEASTLLPIEAAGREGVLVRSSGGRG